MISPYLTRPLRSLWQARIARFVEAIVTARRERRMREEAAARGRRAEAWQRRSKA